jgi:tripartite-type tricarboxylate transporter receptor subunit TctC
MTMKPLAALALLVLAGAAQAQAWPSKPIRLVSPYAPGGTNDVTGRIVAERLQARLGQSVVVENKPGANTRIATEFVAKSAPDGYTLFWVAAPFTVNPAFYDKLPYDSVKDFAPIAHTVSLPVLFSVPAASPARSVKEYLELAKKDPQQATVCSPGSGSGPHLAMEMLAWASGVPLVHVPYKGDAPAVNDLLGGRVGACMNAAGTPLPHVKAGKVRALALVAKERMAQLPDVPTFAQAGLAQVDAFAWFGLLAPAGTPKDILERLNAEVNAVLKLPEVIEKFAGIAAVPIGGSATEFESFIRADLVKWAKVVKERNIKPD